MENNYPKVAIMGGGSFATAIAKIVMENLPNIIWYMRRDDQIAEFKRVGHNPSYLSAVSFDLDRIKFTSKINVAVAEADILFFATPSPFLKSHLKKLRRKIDNKIIVTAIKGIVPDENLVISDYFNKFYGVPAEHVVALSGPCHAEEIALERTSYLTIACPDRDVARMISSIVGGDYLRTSLSEDMYGVEYGAVLKNVYAIAAGICHGLKYGDNFQAVLVSNSIQEMNRFCNAVHPFHRNVQESVYLGDLLVTCYSTYSRNRRFGLLIGRGCTVRSAMNEMTMVAEGYYAAKCIRHTSVQRNVEMPIADMVYEVLYHGASARRQMRELTTKLK